MSTSSYYVEKNLRNRASLSLFLQIRKQAQKRSASQGFHVLCGFKPSRPDAKPPPALAAQMPSSLHLETCCLMLPGLIAGVTTPHDSR